VDTPVASVAVVAVVVVICSVEVYEREEIRVAVCFLYTAISVFLFLLM
jgi:hypothetical protein